MKFKKHKCKTCGKKFVGYLMETLDKCKACEVSTMMGKMLNPNGD